MKSLIYLLMIFALLGCDNSSNIVVFNNYEEGLSNASELNQNVLLVFDFLGNPSSSVKKMIYNKEFEDELQNVTVILLNVDEPNPGGESNRRLQIERYGTDTQPMYYLLNSQRQIIKGPKGYCNKSEFINFIQ